MYILLNKNGSTNRATSEFFCDTPADLEEIPLTEITQGSSAFVLETKQFFLADSSKQWHAV